MELKQFFSENPRFAIAFSGGVDSSYLLYAAKQAGCDVKAYIVKSQLQPQFELDDALRMAYLQNVPVFVDKLDVLQYHDIVNNPINRCYYCKKTILTRLKQLALSDGFMMLCDGTNASDDAGDRHGMTALEELDVRSPLRECGITKAEIRRLSGAAGLFTSDKPSYACLATRIPAGTPITEGLLDKVAHAEEAMHALGFSGFRVRYYHGAAKIQLPENMIKSACEKRKKILEALEPYFEEVLLDLTPRKTEASHISDSITKL
jgi:uncharacterized protein